LSGYRRFVVIIAGIAAHSPFVSRLGLHCTEGTSRAAELLGSEFENADDRVAAPNQDPVESNLLARPASTASLQGIKRSFFFTHDCQGTTGVVRDRVVIGR
jgi:hypothetical protein